MQAAKDILKKVGDLAIRTLKRIEGYPNWFKQRKKVTQFALLYSMIGIIPFVLYPIAAVALQIRSNGFSFKTTPMVSTLAIGYTGAIISGFIAGNKGLGIYLLIAVFVLPMLYIRRGKGSPWIGVLIGFLMLFGLPIGDFLGVRNAPFGISTSPRPRHWCNSLGTSTPATPGLSAQLRHPAWRPLLQGVGRPVTLV